MADLANISVKNITIKVFYETESRNSFCWRYFGHLVVTEGAKKRIVTTDQVYCSVCLSAAKVGSEDVTFGLVKVKAYCKTVSTGNLIRHLKDSHKIICNTAKNETRKKNVGMDVWSISKKSGKGTKSSSGRNKQARNKKMSEHDQWQLANDLALWHCRSLMPFDAISNDGMRDFFKKYNIVMINDELPSCSTVSRKALDEVYESMMSNVKHQIFLDSPQHYAMTFDLWTDRNRHLNYITFRIHYLTNDFSLKAFTLKTFILEENESGDQIEGIIKETKNCFGLNGKSMYAVINTGDNILRSLSNMDYHLCFGQSLDNLVTTDGIKQVEEVQIIIDKSKKIVKSIWYHLPESENNTKKIQKEFLTSLENVVTYLEGDENNPSRDTSSIYGDNHVRDPIMKRDNQTNISTKEKSIPTRLHIVLKMLDSITQFLKLSTINDILTKIGQSHLNLDLAEWKLIDELRNFLQSIRDVVEVMSSQTTSTINVALIVRSEIIDILNFRKHNESLMITKIKTYMLQNINKRLPLTKAMVAAALLDCRFMGLKDIEVYLNSINMNRHTFLSTYIREAVSHFGSPIMLDDVEDPLLVPSNSSLIDEPSTSTSLLYKLSQKHSSNANQSIEHNEQIDQECWRYIASVDPNHLITGELLSYWRNKIHCFPWLSALARAVLCAPAAVSPDSCDVRKSRLCPTKLNKMKFVHDNYKYF